MRIACPHCQAVYEVASVEPDVGFLCSRCHREFHIGEPAQTPDRGTGTTAAPDVQLGLFAPPSPETEEAGAPTLDERHSEPTTLPEPLSEDTDEAPHGTPSTPIVPQIFRHQQAQEQEALEAPGAEAQHAPEELIGPQRRAPRLMAWLSVVMLVVAVAGFAYNYRSWSDNLWLRSLLLNLQMPVSVHADDWRIPPGSVHAEWLKRDDGSSVLVIEGRVENLLHAELATPYIQVTVYDALHPDKVIKRETLSITLPPATDAIRHAPWVTPPQDDVPVASAGSRGFVLVMDKLPPHAGAFTLTVVPSLFR